MKKPICIWILILLQSFVCIITLFPLIAGLPMAISNSEVNQIIIEQNKSIFPVLLFITSFCIVSIYLTLRRKKAGYFLCWIFCISFLISSIQEKNISQLIVFIILVICLFNKKTRLFYK